MYNVLINAYAVAPNWGSEQGMGWNWISNLAKYCNLYVVTEGEWQKEIDASVAVHPYREHLHFYYNPLPAEVRKMCWNQGDWRFYKFYRQWQKSTFEIEKKIIAAHQIDLVHHLNMICFREPGFEWLHDLPFVWGPVGSMELTPTAFLEGEPLKLKFAIHLKNFINNLQRRYQPNLKKALNRAGGLSAATKGVYEFIRDYHHKDVVLINETGCYERELPVKPEVKETFDIIWVGKYDFRKQAGLALEALALLKDCKGIKLHMIGPGTDAEMKRFKGLAESLMLGDSVVWHGRIPNEEVQQLMREGEVFLLTSVMEGTPHVVLEAIQNALPVICFDACGHAGVVNEKVGIKIPQTDKRSAITGFADAIRKLYNDRALLKQMSMNCNQRQKELSWDSKARIMLGLYDKAVNEYKKK